MRALKSGLAVMALLTGLFLVVGLGLGIVFAFTYGSIALFGAGGVGQLLGVFVGIILMFGYFATVIAAVGGDE